MADQIVNDGYYKITTNEGVEATIKTVFTMASGATRWVQLHGNIRPLHEYLDGGYTFMPLVEMTPVLLAALEQLVDATEYLLSLGVGAEDSDQAAIDIVRAMLDDVRPPSQSRPNPRLGGGK